MQEKIQSWINKIVEKWNNLGRRGQIRLVAAAVTVVAALGLTLYFVLRPKWVTVASGIDYNIASSIEGVLSANAIPSRTVEGGRELQVMEAHKYTAIAQIEMQNYAALEGYTFPEALQSLGMGTTQAVQRESLSRVDESDLARTLRSFEGVKAASVHLVVPDDSNFFLVPNQEASASITVETSGTLTKQAGEAMARIVQKAVKNLKPENIVIYDTNYNMLYSGEVSETGQSSRQSEFELQVMNIVDARVRQALNPLYTDVRPIMNFTFNWDKINESSKVYNSPVEDSNAGLVSTEHTEKRNGSSGTNQAEPGLAANDNQSASYLMGEGENSNISESARTSSYLHNVIETVKEGNVGNFLKENSSIGIMAYTYRTYDEEVLTRQGKLENISWEDFKEANKNSVKLDVDVSTIDFLKAGTGIDNIIINAYEMPVFVDAVNKPLEVGQILIYVLLPLFVLLLAYALIKKTQPDEITEIEPELSVEDLLVSTQLDEQKEAEIEKLREIEFGKESEIKKQIEKFVDEKPDAVAQLLRNWLNDDWE